MTGMARPYDNFGSQAPRASSDRIARLKAKTVYGNMKSVAATGGPQPKGDDGSIFNGPLHINPATKCLVHADSYSSWLSATKGKYYCEPATTFPATIDYSSSQGAALISKQTGVNVTDTGIKAGEFNKAKYPLPAPTNSSGIQTAAWDGVVIDPSGSLFYNPCKTVPFMHPKDGASIDLCGNLVSTQSFLPEFAFPAPLKFN